MLKFFDNKISEKRKKLQIFYIKSSINIAINILFSHFTLVLFPVLTCFSKKEEVAFARRSGFRNLFPVRSRNNKICGFQDIHASHTYKVIAMASAALNLLCLKLSLHLNKHIDNVRQQLIDADQFDILK